MLLQIHKEVIVQAAPVIRAALGEVRCNRYLVTGKMAAALRQMDSIMFSIPILQPTLPLWKRVLSYLTV